MKPKIFDSLEEAEGAARGLNRKKINYFCPLARACCVSGVPVVMVSDDSDIVCICWEKAEAIPTKWVDKETGDKAYGSTFNNEDHEAAEWRVSDPHCGNAMFFEKEIYTQ